MNTQDEQMQSIIAAQAAEWFVAHRAGELSEAHREAFIDWLRASPAHTREYLALTGFSADLAHAARIIPAPAEVLVARARGSDGEAVRPLFHSSFAPGRSRLLPWARAGALLAAVAAIVIGVVWIQERTAYATAHAEQRSWRLPDGSTVHLNSYSRIKVDFDAGRRRVDLLAGQAVFQVAHDPGRPFWVNAGDATVKALGTAFDVYRRPQGTLVSVVEGRVAVWRGAGPRREEAEEPGQAAEVAPPLVQLDAGEQANITPSEAVVSREPMEVRKTVAWLQRQIVFERDPLGKVVEEFNRYNDEQLRVDDPALRGEEVSGIFSAYDTESFVEFLKRQPQMRVERVGGDIVIRPARAPP